MLLACEYLLVVILVWSFQWHGSEAIDKNSRESLGKVDVGSQDLYVEVDKNVSFNLLYTRTLQNYDNVAICFNESNYGIISHIPCITVINDTMSVSITVHGEQAGNVMVSVFMRTTDIDEYPGCFVRVTVVHYKSLQIVSDVVGWIYFVAWTVSWYPQIYDNWRWKSVVGLSLDLVALRETGFFLYNLFNVGLFWIPEVQSEYFRTRPHAVNPVQLNDVIFTLHSVLAATVGVVQCLIYDRGNQTISKSTLIILGCIAVTFVVCLILAAASVIQWLTFLMVCANIKLGITFIKYVPQMYMNFKRKSTHGWNITGIWIDFLGGTFSILQMLMTSYNNDDWTEIFGDFTKFGLGLVSLLFDVPFFIQHYFLYKGNIPLDEVSAEDHDGKHSEHPACHI